MNLSTAQCSSGINQSRPFPARPVKIMVSASQITKRLRGTVRADSGVLPVAMATCRNNFATSSGVECEHAENKVMRSQAGPQTSLSRWLRRPYSRSSARPGCNNFPAVPVLAEPFMELSRPAGVSTRNGEAHESTTETLPCPCSESGIIGTLAAAGIQFYEVQTSKRYHHLRQ